jgi:hypothetical protein
MGLLPTTEVEEHCAVDQEQSRPRRRPARVIQLTLALPPGTRLGVYEITAPIGEGAMGQVYRATDTTAGSPGRNQDQVVSLQLGARVRETSQPPACMSGY